MNKKKYLEWLKAKKKQVNEDIKFQGLDKHKLGEGLMLGADDTFEMIIEEIEKGSFD
jgi:hypothetical protein